jgi:hypothetical protein
MAKGDWWIKFEIHTWLNDPKVRRLSRANRDSWLTALCMMRLDGSDRITGTQPQLSHLLGLTLTEFYDFFHDLENSNAADVTHGHASVTDCPEIFTIISRRFRKELKTKEKNRLRKQKQREDVDVTPMSQDRVISKKKEVRKKEEKPPPPPKNPEALKTRPDLSDSDYLTHLSGLPENKHLNVPKMFDKMIAWCSQEGETPSRKRLLNWLDRDRKDLPMEKTNGRTEQKLPTVAEKLAEEERRRREPKNPLPQSVPGVQ